MHWLSSGSPQYTACHSHQDRKLRKRSINMDIKTKFAPLTVSQMKCSQLESLINLHTTDWLLNIDVFLNNCGNSGLFSGLFCHNNSTTHQHQYKAAFYQFSPVLVYDLLDSPDCLPDLLQGSLKNKGRDEAFFLSSFRLQNKAPTSLYSIINPRDNTKYMELSVQAKLSKGKILN